jgi:hypothetical protein
MVRIAHREGKGVVRQHRVNPVGPGRQNAFEERRRGRARLVQADPDDGLAAEIIDGGKFEVIPGISQRRQKLDIDVYELAGALLFVPLRSRLRRPRLATDPARSSVRCTVP